MNDRKHACTIFILERFIVSAHLITALTSSDVAVQRMCCESDLSLLGYHEKVFVRWVLINYEARVAATMALGLTPCCTTPARLCLVIADGFSTSVIVMRY